MAGQSDLLLFFVNGRKVEDRDVDPEMTLLRYLREKLELPGTKQGCGEGGCGACTVMISKYNVDKNEIENYSVNSCLLPIASVHGQAVTTVEGVGSIRTRTHAVQERLAKAHGSQCGFCTPGFVMSMYTILRNNPQPSMQEIEEGLVGNLCRCTGYRPIFESFKTFSKEAQIGCGMKDCCKLMNGHGKKYDHLMKSTKNNCVKDQNETENNGCIVLQNGKSVEQFNGQAEEMETLSGNKLFDHETFTPYHSSQEIIFPPELKTKYKNLCISSVVFRSPRISYFRPTTLMDLLQLKSIYPEAKVVVGNTEVGVEVKYKDQHYPVIISPMNVHELLQINVTDLELEVGAAISLSSLEKELEKVKTNLKGHQGQVLQSILDMLTLFASRQIRNVAAIGGNIMTGSPISDLNPIFMASGTKLKFMSKDSERIITFDDCFYTAYRKNTARRDEVLVSASIPFTADNEYFWSAKQARRRDDDIAIVNCAMKVAIIPQSSIIDSIVLVFGGMAPTTLMAKQTMKVLKGRKWDEDMLEVAIYSLLKEMKLRPSAPGGMVEYRETLCASFFFKFFEFIQQELFAKSVGGENSLLSASKVYHPPKSNQLFQEVPKCKNSVDQVGQPVPHLSSLQQTTGEATYVDDIPKFRNELYASLVTSSKCHAKIIKIDASDALAVDGVIAFFCANDLTEQQNNTGHLISDEEVFASSEVKCVGHVLGIIIAQDQQTARRASKMVLVKYEELPNPIITIQDAISANSFYSSRTVISGDINEGFNVSDHILEGESHIGGQEHFYLETNAHIAIPHENGEMELICTTQNPSSVQASVANALDVPANRVTCRVKRLGGAFGGKISRDRLISVPIAIAAYKLQRPVRLMLDRNEDMLITGTRHPFYAKWKVGFNNDGTLVSVELNIYSNAGCSPDSSLSVMNNAFLKLDGAYRFQNFKATGRCCKTNLPSNCCFRGCGSPQSYYIIEDLVTKVSDFLDMDQRLFRQHNLYESSDDISPFGQVLKGCLVKDCWNKVLSNSEYDKRRKTVDYFNRSNTYKKRGISVMPLKYGIGFEVKQLYQAGALVQIYLDGSVLVTHGGTEIGQGLNTKMIQVTSKVLNIPIGIVYISETSTDKVPNTSPTAASCGTDLNGMAVLNACEILNKRLEPYKKSLPNGQWKDWIKAACVGRVSLSATGFYKTPGLGDFCFDTMKGVPCPYDTHGAAVSEVEIDCLTGAHELLRTDIVMDIGKSLNPGIDIGQIEGAFVQGMGLFTTEELLYSPEGVLITRGPGSYKIPSLKDIPREFNISLLENSKNPRAIFSSKGVGEPPLLLAASVFFAIRDAIRSARKDKEPFQLYSPATVERIRMACEDRITRKIETKEIGSFTPWSIVV